MNSSMCFGRGALAEYAVIGSRPSATATSMRPSVASAVGAPVLVDLPVHERRALVDDLHAVHADVAAAGVRVVRDDGRERDERRRVARPAALDRELRQVDVVAREHDLLARALAHGLRARVGDGLELLQAADLREQPLRRLHVETSATFAPTSSSLSTPNARHMRRSVPNWLMRSGRSAPFGFSNSNADPPAFTVRSTISVISRWGSTSAETRTSSPSLSSSAIQSRRSFSTRRVYGG